MDIPNSLVNQLVDVLTPSQNSQSETICYGTVSSINNDGTINVLIDGSDDIVAQVESSASVSVGDRVSMVNKNHTITITGNTTDPSSKSTDMDTMFGLTDVEDDEVVLDGGKVKSESITGDQIAPNTITADKVVAGVIEAGSIHVKDSNNKTVFQADAETKIVKVGENITGNSDGLSGNFNDSRFSLTGEGLMVKATAANTPLKTDIIGGSVSTSSYDSSNTRYYKTIIGGDSTEAINVNIYRRNPVKYPSDSRIGHASFSAERINLNDKVILNDGGLVWFASEGGEQLRLDSDGSIYGVKTIDTSGKITAGGNIESYGNFISPNNKFLHAHLADRDDTIAICGVNPNNAVLIGHSSYPLYIRSSSISVTDEAKFREGIGLKPTTVSTTAATVSGVTVSGRTCTKIGNLAIVYLYLTIASGTATFSSWTDILSGLPKATSNHVTNVPPTSSSFARALTVRVGTDGNLAIRYGGPGTFYLTMAYPVA